MINLKILNKNQYEAVTRIKGNTLVLAGAGTGKTRVLTFRIAYLLENNVRPQSIYAFTFTNKAGNEMKSRLNYLNCDISKSEISTFHSFCYSYLYHFAPYLGYKEYFTIIDEDDKLKIIRDIIKNHDLEMLDTEVALIISSAKNHTKYPYKNLKDSVIANFIFHRYQNSLLYYNKMDLDDLLYQFYRLLNQESYILEHFQESCEYILVDECQDINNIQYEILLLLAKKHNNMFLVGDQDQCIYAFRGSNIENINHFIDHKQAKVIKLEENYRSNKNILEIANNLIRNNKIRLDKNLFTVNTEQNFQVIHASLDNDKEEANYVAKLIKKLTELNYKYYDIAILYRNNSLSNNLERELISYQIPYQKYGGYSFFKYKEIKTLIQYYFLLINNNDDLALKEVCNLPVRGIGGITLQTIEDITKKENISLFQAMKQSENESVKNFIALIETLTIEFKEQNPKSFVNYLIKSINYYDYLMKQNDSKSKINRVNEFIIIMEEIAVKEDYHNSTIEFLNQINLLTKQDEDKKEEISLGFTKLMTIHASKGLEFKVVIVIGCNEGILPSYKTDIMSIEEERRIFYVAITRARERLYLIDAKRRFINGKLKYLKPSTFLDNINPNLLLLDKFH